MPLFYKQNCVTSLFLLPLNKTRGTKKESRVTPQPRQITRQKQRCTKQKYKKYWHTFIPSKFVISNYTKNACFQTARLSENLEKNHTFLRKICQLHTERADIHTGNFSPSFDLLFCVQSSSYKNINISFRFY